MAEIFHELVPYMKDWRRQTLRPYLKKEQGQFDGRYIWLHREWKDNYCVRGKYFGKLEKNWNVSVETI